MDFRIQASNPRSMQVVAKEIQEIFEDIRDIPEALETVFPVWTESAIMVWRGIYIPLGYKYCISEMLPDIMTMLDNLMQVTSGQHFVQWPPNTFAVRWRMQWSDDSLEIQAEWDTVIGFTEPLLAARSTLTIDKWAFMSEWKQVLGIALKALEEAGYRAAQLPDLEKLQRIYNEIREPGILYRESGCGDPARPAA